MISSHGLNTDETRIFRKVLECASPLALGTKSGRGLPQSKTLSRELEFSLFNPCFIRG
jgi:hypothetical protein